MHQQLLKDYTIAHYIKTVIPTMRAQEQTTFKAGNHDRIKSMPRLMHATRYRKPRAPHLRHAPSVLASVINPATT